jgi:fumarate reductase iron-sulfur subunit
MEDINKVPMIIRREIEALIAAPIIKAFNEEFGREQTLRVLGKVIEESARQAGIFLKDAIGDNSMQGLPKLFDMFKQGDALEFDIHESTPTMLKVNITKCKYAEMYRRLGLEDYGYALSCARDFALFKGFNPNIRFTRTQTIMEGSVFCDFCWSAENE